MDFLQKPSENKLESRVKKLEELLGKEQIEKK